MKMTRITVGYVVANAGKFLLKKLTQETKECSQKYTVEKTWAVSYSKIV